MVYTHNFKNILLNYRTSMVGDDCGGHTMSSVYIKVLNWYNIINDL